MYQYLKEFVCRNNYIKLGWHIVNKLMLIVPVNVDCAKCKSMTSVCQKVLTNGMLTLKDAYSDARQGSHYSAFNARRRLLQMPLACVCIQFKPGQSECYIIQQVTMQVSVHCYTPSPANRVMMLEWTRQQYSHFHNYAELIKKGKLCVTLFVRHLAYQPLKLEDYLAAETLIC